MPDLKTVKDIHTKVWKHFIYVTDKRNYMKEEHWTSHAKEVEEGKKFKDDCDGFALTCAELLIKAGFAKKDVMAIYCVVETGEAHLVCGVHVDDETYILDNRERSVYNWEKKKTGPKNKRYKWGYFMPFNKPGKWLKVTNTIS